MTVMDFVWGSLFCDVVLRVPSSFSNYLAEEERSGYFTLCCGCLFYVSSSPCCGFVCSVIVAFPGHMVRLA